MASDFEVLILISAASLAAAKVTKCRGPQEPHHLQKAKANPEAPKLDTLLALAGPRDPVDENQQDWRERTALVQHPPRKCSTS